MVAVGEDELTCDFAQIYQITDWRALPLKTAAVLAAGLPDSSRIRRKLSGDRIDLTTALLAMILDRLKVLCWQNTEDGINGRNYPESTFERLTGRAAPRTRVSGFRSPEAFEAAREKIIKGE